jgi:hypothetical protein
LRARRQLSLRARLLRSGLLDQRTSRLEPLLRFRALSLEPARAGCRDRELRAISRGFCQLERQLLELAAVSMIARKPRPIRPDEGTLGLRDRLTHPSALRPLRDHGKQGLG